MNVEEAEELLLNFFGKREWDEFPLVLGQRYVTADCRIATHDVVSTDGNTAPSFMVAVVSESEEEGITLRSMGAALRRLHLIWAALESPDVLVSLVGKPTFRDMNGLAFFEFNLRMAAE